MKMDDVVRSARKPGLTIEFIVLLSPLLIFSYIYATLSILEDKEASFEAIYQFGDSTADTGNNVLESPHSNCGMEPYGQSALLRHPTGRCSDGLLIVDFIAQALNLPFLEPYLDKDGDFRHGVNFAVGGATALNVSTLAAKGISVTGSNCSLLVQLDWFKSHLSTSCTSLLECKQKLGKALFLVGDIGGNDYDMGAAQGTSMEDLYVLVPEVIQTIVNVIKELIDLGAKRIVVPGNFPVGCMTLTLVIFKTNDSMMYDELNCLTSWNELAVLHNVHLQNAIEDLRKEHRHVVIAYGDYYTPFTTIIKNARSLGFEEEGVHKACCGNNVNEYNCEEDKICGADKVQVCQNPDKRVSWDGTHLTQHAYRLIADWLLEYTIPTVMNNNLSIPFLK